MDTMQENDSRSAFFRKTSMADSSIHPDERIAQLEELSDEEQELINSEKEAAGIEVNEDESDSATAITETDAGYYLYRVNINNGVYELIGTTNYEERHSSYVYRA